jgi:hypothetical protein
MGGHVGHLFQLFVGTGEFLLCSFPIGNILDRTADPLYLSLLIQDKSILN